MLSLPMLTQTHITYGGDTQSRNLYCTSQLVQETSPSDMVSCTGFFLVQVSCTEYSTALFPTRNLHARD